MANADNRLLIGLMFNRLQIYVDIAYNYKMTDTSISGLSADRSVYYLWTPFRSSRSEIYINVFVYAICNSSI